MKTRQRRLLWENLQQKYAIWHFIRYKRIADYVNDTDGKHLLDVGCGIGLLDLLIENKDIIGIDVDRKNIRKGKRLRETMKLNQNRIQNLVVDLHFPPFKEKFDAVICSEVLEHLTHDAKALEALISVLNEDGLLLITLPNVLRFEFPQLFRLSLRPKRMYPGHIREYKMSDAYALIGAFPLRIEKITGLYFDFPLFHIFRLLTHVHPSLRFSTKLRFFVFKALYQIYATFWMALERLLPYYAYYILILVRKSSLKEQV